MDEPISGSKKAFGSGYFGEWIEDEFLLPAYRYTCDQTSDPAAVSPVNLTWRAPTDHSHQVGNDRLVSVASNYGYVQVRQDEGSPKFLNDYEPSRQRYAGGFGYLTDGQAVLSTFYSAQAESFERIFGIGYYRKVVGGAGCAVDQVVFAPFGDDPLLISQVTITNRRMSAVDLRWIEYWGCQTYQFSFRAMILASVSRGKQSAAELRRAAAGQYRHHFTPVGDGEGLLDTQSFSGYTAGQRAAWGMAQFFLATVARGFTGGPVRRPVKEAGLEDYNPPPIFLAALDGPADAMATDETAFFGKGGPARPDGLDRPLSAPGAGSGLFLERKVHLAPGGSQTLYFAYGYLPDGFWLDDLLARYRRDLPGLWARSSAAWHGERIRLELPGEEWVDRELIWHNYYLRSNLTYDSFFKEHILSQGHVYQYLIGFQGAARDPLQHALPFTFTRPAIVKEILRYTLKEVRPDGEIPYGVVGMGMRTPMPFKPSDQELWLLWLASEYVLATRDLDFLAEQIPTYPLYGPKAGRATVDELLKRCYRHLMRATGAGRHGLLRLSNGDWNDSAVIGFVPKKQEEQVRQHGESVLNAAFAAYALADYARLLEYAGETVLCGEVSRQAEEQRQAVRGQWTGQWFRRAWLSEELGWIGENELWLEPQPWAILSGAAAPEQREALVHSLDERVRRPSPIGAMLLDRDIPQLSYTGRGVWASINGTLIWALSQVDGRMAWEEWQKNSLACHAEAYPAVWYGIWSGPDVLNSVLSKYPGQTFFDEKIMQGEMVGGVMVGVNWTDFPVMNMHPHAWPLYTAARLMGLRFTPQGLEMSPCLPQETYRFESPLLGLEKTPRGYQGWYAPLRPGHWQMSLRLPDDERGRSGRLVVNGQEEPLSLGADGVLHWSGESEPGKPLRWEVLAG